MPMTDFYLEYFMFTHYPDSSFKLEMVRQCVAGTVNILGKYIPIYALYNTHFMVWSEGKKKSCSEIKFVGIYFEPFGQQLTLFCATN